MFENDLGRPFADLSEQVESKRWGKYRATVESVDDRDKQGQIVVKIPSVYGKEPSPPCRPAVSFAGKDYGCLFMPEKGDGVWVEFEDGNTSLPVWTGFWWAKNEQPKDAGAGKRVIVTKAGLKVILDDNAETIHLAHTDKSEITLSADSITLKVGPAKLVIDKGGVSINGTTFKVSK